MHDNLGHKGNNNSDIQNIKDTFSDESFLFRNFFFDSQELMCIATTNGIFKVVNPSFTRVLGYSQEELLGKTFLEFVHPDDKESSVTELNNYLAGDSTYSFENRYITKNKDIVYLQWVGTIDRANNVIYAQARDITSTINEENKLLRNQELYFAAMKVVSLGSWSFTLADKSVLWSPEIYEIFEIDVNTANLFDDYLSRFNENDRNLLLSYLQEAIEQGISYTFQHAVNLPNGNTKWVHCSGLPIKNDKGKVIRVEGVIQEITEEKKAQERLLRSEKLLNAAQSLAKLGSWSYLLETNEVYWSKELYKIYEINPNSETNLMEAFMALHSEEDSARLNKKIENAIVNREPYTLEHLVKLPSGQEKWVIGSGIPVLDMNGKVVQLEGIVQDITEIKKSQETILSNIKEKETLLKELHHRVKNNMQLISSMLSLQLNYFDDEKLRNAIRDSQQRIKSMSTVHDLLYRSGNLTQINFDTYIKELISELVTSYSKPDEIVQVDINIDPVYFTLDTAVPLGLLINEIITNSLKHAFCNSDHNKIEFNLLKLSENNFELSISDNGKGIVAIDQMPTNTLGTMLIDNLADQMDGILEKNSDHNGTSYNLKFSTLFY